ncbi:MAG: 1-acyl-sn-glycerol-3-phosphate acyltransferase [Erysipelotrichia bacterium]|nr:1-acyl-sn-glycerol-3-phosphate acyltransferase [Erysipelotrichia bacterium]
MLTPEVKNNIIDSLKKGELNSKVMIGDHVVTSFERSHYIIPYDNTKRKITNKLRRAIATSIVNGMTKRINKSTKIEGLENLHGYQGAAIITANHFSPVDSTIVRYFANRIGKKRKLTIVVAESNIFMPGTLGWLLKSVNTMPYTHNLSYLENNFNPSLEKRLKERHLVLFYPEQEMWPGYTKPRNLKPGAYHYACKYNVPIISTFITMKVVEDAIKYTIHVMPLIYPDPELTFKENKEHMMQLDYSYKKMCYESVYNKKLTYEFSESDLIY